MQTKLYCYRQNPTRTGQHQFYALYSWYLESLVLTLPLPIPQHPFRKFRTPLETPWPPLPLSRYKTLTNSHHHGHIIYSHTDWNWSSWRLLEISRVLVDRLLTQNWPLMEYINKHQRVSNPNHYPFTSFWPTFQFQSHVPQFGLGQLQPNH